jgi:integrase
MLSVKKVARAIKSGRGRYHDGFGLNLVVKTANNASWQLRYQIAGRERWLGLGPAHLVTIGEARVRARRARLQLLDGLDPIEEKKKLSAATALSSGRVVTFREAVRGYFAVHQSRWRKQKSRNNFLASLETFANPVLGNLAVSDIGTGEILRTLEAHWSTKPATMSKVRGRIEAVLDWCTVRGYRRGENPARWKNHLAGALPARSQIAKIKHLPALPYRDISGFMAELRERDGVAARALEFTILTAARSAEVLGAPWNEMDLTNVVWTIPASRMKGNREHRVPLSETAVKLLLELPREGEFVFIGASAGRPLYAMSMMATLQRMGRGDITVHGFRSSFRDWAAETTSHANIVVEAALAHAIPNAVEAAYRRGDLFEKRRKLMEAWADYCGDIPSAVVPLRAVS